MPEARFGSWEMPDSEDWFSVMRDNARDAMAALRRIRNRDDGSRETANTRDDAYTWGYSGFVRYIDKDGNRVVKKVKDIEFGPTGRRALVGEDEPDQEAA